MRRAAMTMAAVAGLTALGACSGASDADLADEYNEDRADYIAREDRVLALPVTDPSEMPVAGSATYAGEAAMILETADTDLSMVGDAEITADFGAGTLSGRADDFVGTETGEDVQGFDGALVLSDGAIDGNEASGVLSGTLTGDDNTVEVDTFMVGAFGGADGPDAVALYSAFGSATIDGDDASGQIGIVAER